MAPDLAGLTHVGQVHRGQGIRTGHVAQTHVPAVADEVAQHLSDPALEPSALDEQDTRGNLFVVALCTTVRRASERSNESLSAVAAMTRGIRDASLHQ